ncbi:AT-rich interactive domain-containing protein 4B-like [Limulus polyphemus]|uniref:AT-rich interactive domain-containing protein 4B-like n=1 Tax=Limulus polyphemus TaxID=6850 RepID=A0ABM1B5G3_LIMPO|nr:AT-rich interactive domain-containing protein 4B-like [Limulus polyphemus]
MKKASHTNGDSLFSSLVEFSSHLSLMNSENQNKPDVYTVLENTPPTTPETLESVASNSPAYEQYGSSIESICTSTETESTGETKTSVVLECEDSYSQDDSTFPTVCTNNGIVKAGASGSTGKHNWSNSDATREYPSRKYRKKAHKHHKGKHSLKIPREDSKSTSLSIKHVKSNAVSTSSPSCDPSSRSHWTPRFNFCVPLDDYKDADERIAILQEKLSELKKTYMALKAEVALIDRRRKKAKKKEKEADGEASSGPSSLSVPLAEHQLSS